MNNMNIMYQAVDLVLELGRANQALQELEHFFRPPVGDCDGLILENDEPACDQLLLMYRTREIKDGNRHGDQKQRMEARRRNCGPLSEGAIDTVFAEAFVELRAVHTLCAAAGHNGVHALRLPVRNLPGECDRTPATKKWILHCFCRYFRENE
jgi:hypothetical protein